MTFQDGSVPFWTKTQSVQINTDTAGLFFTALLYIFLANQWTGAVTEMYGGYLLTLMFKLKFPT